MLLGSTKNPDGARSEYDNGAAEWKSPSVRSSLGQVCCCGFGQTAGAGPATTALLWPVIPLVVAWLFATAPRGFWRRRARSEN